MSQRILAGCLLLASVSSALAEDGNRLTYLDSPCDPYYVHRTFPRLITPQWMEDAEVEAVVTLGIDDMRDPATYEAYLRPILERLKKIDGRAPVSIMSNSLDPQHPQFAPWLKEGLSIECHTADHPCPCLQRGDFAAARSTYERNVDQIASIAGNLPVAFRFPCMDSMNTPSPRAYAEILNDTTEQGKFLQMSSSVSCFLTSNDPELPRSLALDDQGRQRFLKYQPFRWYVNKIEDYPYPYVIGRSIWEFPTAVPDDWQGQHLHQPFNPQTVRDYQAAIDAVVVKQGVANLAFHPYGWIRNSQMIEVIEHAVDKHGKKVKFLTFRECLDHIHQHMLSGEPLRAENGQDNGVRLLDLNHDGYLDVVIGNDRLRRTRLWQPEARRWKDAAFPVKIVHQDAEGNRSPAGVQFFICQPNGNASLLVCNETIAGVWHFNGSEWVADDDMLNGLQLDGEPVRTARNGRDQGVRLRDLDGDGCCELIAGGAPSAVFRWDGSAKTWKPLPFELPPQTAVVDATGNDAGLRFVDVDGDLRDDVIFSNEQRFSLHLFTSMQDGWSRRVCAGERGDPGAIPMISRLGANNGAWFAQRHLWVQNEDTHRLPDGVDRRSFADLLGDADPRPLSPEAASQSFETHPGFRVEQMAAEPLVQDPVHFDFGPDGKLWVVEMADYPLGLDGAGQPGGRVRYLEDTNGDGRYDKSTLFLEGLNFPTGVLAWREGVLVSAAPDVLYAEDTDGDGRADRRQVLYRGFGEGNQQHRVNGFWRGLDNWVHVANGDSGGAIRSVKTGEQVDISGRDLRIKPDEGLLEATTGMTQYGRDRDDWGNWFGCNNSVPVFHFVLADRYLRRNPHLAAESVRREICATHNTPVYPAGRVLSHFYGYQPPAPGEPSRFTSANSVTIYGDPLFGESFAGNAFISEPVHSLIHRHVLSPDGVSFTGARAADRPHAEFLASHDPWSRPCGIRIGPDGAQWFADMYRMVIEHPEWIDDNLERQLNLRAGHERGRIYRVIPVDEPTRPISRLDRLDTDQLVAALDSASSWQRDMARQMLLWRGDAAAVKPLEELLARADRPQVRLQALCTLDGLDAITPRLLRVALADEHAAVRRHAIRVSEPLLNQADGLGRELLRLLDDENPQVTLQLAYSLGEWDDADAGRALGKLALRYRGDSYLTTAVASSLHRGNVAEVLAIALQAEGTGEDRAVDDLLRLVGPVADEATVLQVLRRIVGRERPLTADQMVSLAELLDAVDRPDDPEFAKLIAPPLRQAREIIQADDPPAALALAAIRLLGLGGHWQDAQRLAALLVPQRPLEIQAATVAALSEFHDPRVAGILLANWPSHGPALRRQILDLLLTRNSWTRTMLQQVETGVIEPADVDATRRGRLFDHPDEQIQQMARKVLQTAANEDRAKLIARYEAERGAGSVEAGRELFKKHCASCHRVGDQGHDVGPDLRALRDRSPRALLTAILDPNRAVEDKYRGYLMITQDGRQFTGLLKAETGASVTLTQADGTSKSILRKDIEQLLSTGKSLMPEGLEQEIGPAEMRHLLAFAVSLDTLRKEFPGNRPRMVTADADGGLNLPADAAEIRGTSLVFEQQYGNLGYWLSADDRAEWALRPAKAGDYELWVDWALHDNSTGGKIRFQIADATLVAEVPGTGTWDDYRWGRVGKIRMPAGAQRLVATAKDPINSALIDLRTIRLIPAESDSRPQGVDW